MKRLVLSFSFILITVFTNAQNKNTTKFYEIASTLMETYYTTNFYLSGDLNSCSDELKIKLSNLCNKLDNLITDDKSRLVANIDEKDFKDLEFQLNNYKQLSTKEDITAQQLASAKLWIKLSKATVERIFISLID